MVRALRQRCASSAPDRMGRLDALQRALGLDRYLRIVARRRPANHAQLLVTLLVAGDLDVLGIDVLTETRYFVGAKQVGARDHAAAVLHADGHLGVGNGGAARVADESEI